MFDKEKNENVENLRTFVTQEAEFEMAAAETIHSLHRIGNKDKIDHAYFGSSQQSNKFKYQKKCVFCNLDHSLWDCVQFKSLEKDKDGMWLERTNCAIVFQKSSLWRSLHQNEDMWNQWL